MGQYEVRHQTDKTCADCSHYDQDSFEDSFGPYTDECCAKGHHKRVGYSVDACKDYMPEETEVILHSRENKGTEDIYIMKED